MELVIYDEVERFPSHDDDFFSYPFTKRKNIAKSWTVTDVSEVSADYTYYNQVI
jgi:hypothetical protein